MSNIKVSVVVPIYKVEKYLDQCIESIVNQTYKNLEIILIDDGSPDNCPKMCDDWAKKDKRIKVVHKRNQGLGMARNSGIENATGNYICFIDSDDFIEKNTFKKCIDKIKKFSFDIVYYGHDKHDGINSLKKYIPTPSKFEYYNNELIVRELLPELIIDIPNTHQSNMILSACMCLINLSLIRDNNWKFVSEREIISEDIYSMFKLLKKSNSIAIIDEIFYHYRVNDSSLTHTFREDRFDKVKKLYIELKKLINNDDKFLDRFNYLFLSYSIVCIKQIVGSNLKFLEKKKFIMMICNDYLLRNIIDCYIERESKKRKLYFIFIKKKCFFFIYFLTYIQIKIKA